MPQTVTFDLSDAKPIPPETPKQGKAITFDLSDAKPITSEGKTSSPSTLPPAKENKPISFNISEAQPTQTPQEKIFQSTVSEGQSPERAQSRVNEYNYGIKQGMNPERAQQFALSLQWNDTPPKVMAPEEIKAVADNVRAMSKEDREKQFIFGDPDEFAKGYAEARARGMSEDDAIEYGSGNMAQRATMRAGQWLAPKWRSVKTAIIGATGAEHPEERAENPWFATNEGARKNELKKYSEASWIDKHIGKIAGSLDSHLWSLADGFTTPDMAALEVVSFGEAGLSKLLPEVGEEATVAARATRLTQRTLRTTQQLAHAGFTAQMASGSVQSFGAAWNEGKEGNVSEAIGYTLDGLVNGLISTAGVRSLEAHAEVRQALDDTTGKFYPDKKFTQLSDKQQALMVQKLIDDDPRFKNAADASQKEMKKNAKRLQRRYSEALGQAWNPNAAQRAINDLQAERVETARKDQLQKVVDTIKARVQQRTDEIRAEEEERQSAAREGREEKRKATAERREQVQQTAEEIAKGREETFASRQAIGEAPTEEETSRHVEAEESEGHVSYPVQYWGETNRFGVGTDGERHSVYRQTPRGVEWLDRTENFTENPESLYFNADPQTSDTVAKLSSLKLAADGLAAQPEATAEQVKDAETLGEIRRQLIEGEINATEAQKRAGIAEKATLPDLYTAAREGRLNGPFHEKSSSEYASEVEKMMRESNSSEEEIQATLESLPEFARVQIESNLHHVYQPGDYIISKRDVKWTLDAKGLLHPSDGGNPIPLMKRGTYSNQALQLAASGRVGYGSKTRLERRADFARNRDIKRQIKIRQEEFDREMRLAQQNAGLEAIPHEAEPAYEPEREERRKQFIDRPPVPEETRKAREQRRAAYKASSDPNNIINQLAKQYGVTPDEVMRIGLSERTPTIEAKAASLEVGDRISDPFRPDRPWIVEEKDGAVQLRSGQANPIPFDRLNPSPRVFQILEKGEITHDRDWTDAEREKVAFEKPYLVHQRMLVDGVRDRMEGKVRDPEPKTQAQADKQAEAADNRKDAAHAKAVKAAEDAANPVIAKDDTPESATAKAEEAATKAEDSKKIAKEAVAQAAEAKAKAGPKGEFPQRSPISIHLRGNATTIDQNNRQIKAHYELVPAGAVIISHQWDGDNLVRTDEKLFPKELQPREPNERTILQRRMDAQLFAVSDDGKTSGYNFAKYANKTIDALSGPPLVEPGGRTVSGNGRLQRLLKHLQVIDEIPDPEMKAITLESLKSGMAALAKENGIGHYPDDGQFYLVVRMMDDPIQTVEEATKLGLLFNESEADNISDSQKGLVYSRSFDQDVINKIGRMVEESEGGLNAAMRDNPTFFAEIVASKFDIPKSQDSLWFMKNKMGDDVLTEQGEKLFRRAMNGYVIQDPDLLAGIEGEVAYRAFENAIGYISRLKVFPELDLTGKIKESLEASRLTSSVNRDLAVSRDPWDAVYAPDQIDLAGMETDVPPEPDRMTEALWRSLNASKVAAPRVFSDRMKKWISDEDTQQGMFDSTEKALENPVDRFNRVFASELKDTAYRRNKGTDKAGTPDGWMLSQSEYDAALRGQEISDEERVEEKKPEPEVKAEAKPVEIPKFGKPPEVTSPAVIADRNFSAAKSEQGYVTPQQLREFLDVNPATKGHAPELMRTAQKISEYVYDADPPVGVERKQALDWVLRERVGRIEAGERKGVRGEYVDPALEKGLANGILRLHKAADPTSFIHEFSHIVFPLLSDEDLRAIDTIGKRVWTENTPLKGDTYVALSEKLASGMEQFLRDENPTGFTDEVKAVLAKIKTIMRNVYLAFKGDPLSEYRNTEESRGVFAKMFGITDFDVADDWREEVKKARAAEKKIVKPEDQPHPIVQLAKELGGTGLSESIDGKVVDEVGERVDPKKPVATITFASKETAALAASRIAGGEDKIGGAQLIEGKDGIWGVKINSKTKVPRNALYQSLPERHPGLQLEDLEKRLKDTPSFKTFERRLLQMQIDNLRNRIRADHGVEEAKPQNDSELPKQVMQEAKNAKAPDRGRKTDDGVPGISKPPRVGGIPKPPQLGVSGYGAAKRGGAAPRSSVPRAPVNLENVKPVNLQPLTGVRGESVGTITGEAFDQKAWVEGLKRSGVAEGTPPPTWALDPKTAAQLIYPGQKQNAQTIQSALRQGDGVVVVTPPRTGKTWLAGATVKEWMSDHPNANILFITKNKGLLKKFKRVAANSFGFDVELDAPAGENGVYAASYMKMLKDATYKNTKWDLVISDEAGEARRWYDEDTQQGQMLKDVVANSEKAVYMSATPFHSPMEYGYLDKLNLWPKGQFDKWIQENFAHEKVGDKIVARLDPAKQMKLREQLIERGQMVSQAISYDGYNAHFGVVSVTDSMKRGLDRIREGFDRARDQLSRMGKTGLARRAAAFEAVYTKNFLERERLPQTIELAKKGREQGWRVLIFSEHTADDLFRRERIEGEEASTYQQLDDAMGGQLSKIIPPYPSIYNELYAEFGEQVGDYSGSGNTDAEREASRIKFLKGELPILYSSYAGGGIGVDMHDADFPEYNIKGGDKPILAIYMGPPYSGVLLEQAMGRPWGFGSKSDVHAVFLATDSEPDIRLMQTKVGPRMKALRAAVLGEKDSLANVMSTYTDEEKVRERQDQLAYSEGNEVKVNATQFQVRSKQRNVGIQDWSAITFPSAEEAKNKGMKYGEAVAGGDWSSLYQSKFELRPPDSPENARAKEEIDVIGAGAKFNPPPSLQNLEPADRNAVVGAASAMAADGVELPVDRDKEGVARQTMQWALHIPKKMELTYERERTRFGFKKTKAVWKFPEGKEPYNRPIGPFGDDEIEDKKTRYIGWGSMKGGIESMTRQAGVPEIGLQLTDMIGYAQRDQDVFKSMYRYYAIHAFEDNGLKRDGRTVAEVRSVAEGKTTSANPAINKAAAEMHDLNEWAASEVQKAGVKRHVSGGKWEPWIPRKDYFTHQIDWDAEVEYQNPHTGVTEREKLKDAMKRTFADEKTREIVSRLASMARNSDGTAVSPEAMDRWLRQHYRRGTPIQPNIQEQRTIEFPILKNDWGVIDNYGDQLGKAIGIARNFGPEREKINELVAKIPSAGARRDITTIFDSILSPQQLSGNWRKFTNAMTGFTALTKMPLSFAKVPFHSMHMAYALHGDVRPMVKAAAKMMTDFKRVYDDNVYIGTLARQTDFTGAIEGWQSAGAQHWMFDVTGFNAMYNVSRIFASEAAKVEMEQYIMHDLLKGGKRAEEARRILNHTMLIGDGDIDKAIANRRFSDEDIRRAQVAFSNEVMFTDNPTEMPKWAREPITKETAGSAANVFRAMRLSYSMASFTVKTRRFLRKHIWDETFRYQNPKMLALFAVMEPIIGAGVTTVGSTLKSGIQRSIEGATGQQKKEDALDREKLLFKNAWEGGWGKKGLAEKAELYIDLLTWGTAQEQIRLMGDMLLNTAANPKKAVSEARFFGPDILEGVVGPIWNSTVVRPLGWATDEVAIWARGGPKESKRAWARLWKEIFGETSISSNIPQVKRLTAPPK